MRARTWTRKPARRLRLTTAQSLTLGFAALVLAGGLLLRLPIASRDGTVQPLLDALFTATSAVTTTGLVVVDTGSFYSIFGQLVILVLIQIGGLGYMVLLAFLAILVGRRLSLRASVTLGESIAGFEENDERRFVGSVIWYTLVFEVGGMVAFTAFWMRELPAPEAAYLGLFHSISAFCTAGFGLYPDSFMRYRDSVAINATIAAVTIAGALGFFVLRDLWRCVAPRRTGAPRRRLSVHSKLTLSVTLILNAAGTAILLLSESAALGASWSQRLAAATFQALSASTTTGFNSIDIGAMSAAGLFCLVLLMFVGASPGGTGGGIKTTTLGVVLSAARALLRGSDDAVVFERRVDPETVRRATTIGLLATALVAADTLVLAATERAPFLPLLFEVVSAFGTAGLSAGVTSGLSDAGKVVISITMLIGRLGPLAIGFALLDRVQPARFRYAKETVFVG